MKKISIAAIAGLIATVLSAGPTVAQTKIRLAHELPITHYGHVYIDKWAKLVKERSKGELDVSVFPSGQLYKDADAVQALASGTLDMQLAVASYLGVVIPAVRIVDMPYLVPSAGDLPGLLDPSKPLGKYINERAKEKGLNILAWWAAGDVLLLSGKAPINSAADLKGLTIRVIGGGASEAGLKAIGGNPIHLSPVELQTAVSQGTVDGFQSTYSFWKIFPSMKYGSSVGGLYTLGYAVVASDKFMAKLTPAQKEILLSTLAEVTADEIKGVKELDDKDRALLEGKGHQVTTLPPAEIKKWRELAEPVYKEFEKDVGADVIKLLQAQRTK
jgi:TRAP-type C4-dicarboxylate transport system substrate-binding protein